MADYGDAYAWNEEGVCIGIGYSFTNHSGYKEIVLVESELEQWSASFSIARDNDPSFPWDDFNRKGRSLTRKLADLLRDTNITIVYKRPHEDPEGKHHIEETII